jgi:hypothetical protein
MLEEVAILLANAVSLQAALFVVLVLAEQQTLLARLFATGAVLVGGVAWRRLR